MRARLFPAAGIIFLQTHRLPANATESIIVPETLPKVPTKPPPIEEEQEIAAIPAPTLKRKAEEAELDADAEQAGKKAKADDIRVAANGVIDLDGDDDAPMQVDAVPQATNGSTAEVIDLD